VRAERLQDISEEDIAAEGVMPTEGIRPFLSFACLWQSINSKRHSWDSNPWVWAIEFKVAEVKSY